MKRLLDVLTVWIRERQALKHELVSIGYQLNELKKQVRDLQAQK